jgi:hypothetical protein
MRKYKEAYEFLMTFWNSFPDEEKQEINCELNYIFGEKRRC